MLVYIYMSILCVFPPRCFHFCNYLIYPLVKPTNDQLFDFYNHVFIHMLVIIFFSIDSLCIPTSIVIFSSISFLAMVIILVLKSVLHICIENAIFSKHHMCLLF